jgi:hypothetical protein
MFLLTFIRLDLAYGYVAEGCGTNGLLCWRLLNILRRSPLRERTLPSSR